MLVCLTIYAIGIFFILLGLERGRAAYIVTGLFVDMIAFVLATG